jgi:hypothetical protein
LRWFPSAVYLADNAVKSPQRERVLITPNWRPTPDLAHQLAVRGLTLDDGRRFGNFTLYTVQEQTHAVCAWCLCQPRTPFPLLQPEAAIALLQRSERP